MTKPKLASKSSEDEGRFYRIPGRVDEHGKQRAYPSVTNVLAQVNKPGLYQWVADQTAAFAVANITQLNQRDDQAAWSFLRFYWNRTPDLTKPAGLRSHHDGVRDDAADLGTNVHELIEADIDGGIPMPAVEAPEVWEMVGAWESWYDRHEIVSHHTEFTVVHDGLRYAGTADADWTITCLHARPCVPDGSRCLVDLKTSRYTWPEHGMQLAALAQAPVAMVEVPEGTPGAVRAAKTEDGVRVISWWLEREQPTYDRAVLLHIRPRDLTPRGDRIEAFCELKDMTEDLDLYAKGFEGALRLCEVAQSLKARGDRRALVSK